MPVKSKRLLERGDKVFIVETAAVTGVLLKLCLGDTPNTSLKFLLRVGFDTPTSLLTTFSLSSWLLLM